MKRGLILSDTHNGNYWGLNPPGFMSDEPAIRKIQETFWNWFIDKIEEKGPFDFLFGLGDFTDGEGRKGTLDTQYTDVRRQALAAVVVLEATKVDPAYCYLVRGTPFHTSGTHEYEDAIADHFCCPPLENVQRKEIEGWKIHTRHVAGRSDIPYGQATPLLKELARLEHEAFRDQKDAPDVILRGHVHYDCQVSKHRRIAIDCPCLELPLSESNGRRYAAWEYDVGFGILELEAGKLPHYEPVIMDIKMVHAGGYDCVTW